MNIDAWAAKRGLPANRRTQRQWSCFQVLSPAMKKAVREHEQHCRQTFPNDGLNKQILANLSQRPTYFPAKTGIIPALLRSSLLWSIPGRRLVVPYEYFEIQGYNMFDADATQCSFINILDRISHRKLRMLAGNAMHLRVVGAAIMFIMACSEPA